MYNAECGRAVNETLKSLHKPNMSIIRPMIESDLPQVLAIEQVCFPEGWSHRQFLDELQNGRSVCVVAEAEGRVAGYLCLSFLLDIAEVMNIAVDPARQGSGIGRCLLEWGCAEAVRRGADKIQLEVRASSSPAIALYRQYGFVQTGLRKNYYKNGIDAILMDKQTGGKSDAV